MNKINSLLLSASAAILLVACSDNIAEVQESSYTVAPELDQKLSKKACGPGNAGALLFAASSPQNFVCDGSDWIPWTRPNSDQKLGGPKVACAEGSYDPSRQMCDSRDGQVYSIVQIGEQTWMAENLNYELKLLPEGAADSVDFSWCGGGESGAKNEGDCSVYGRLYTWAGAMDSAAAFSDAGKGCGYGSRCTPAGDVQGVCPSGWHLPSDAEWSTLLNSEKIGGPCKAGPKLKSADGWYNSGNGDDSFGFAVLPAGYRNYGGGFDKAGNSAYFWISAEYDSYNAYSWSFYNNCDADLRYGYEGKGFALSVRCLKD